MVIRKIINDNKTVFENICQSHHVQKLYAFGSSVSDKFDYSASDIDLLVEMEIEDPMEKGELLMNFWDRLEEFFERKVDLLTPSSIINPFLNDNIEATKVLIYDGKQQKVSV
jgi:predicted nucleotidyltransferase